MVLKEARKDYHCFTYTFGDEVQVSPKIFTQSSIFSRITGDIFIGGGRTRLQTKKCRLVSVKQIAFE